MESLLIEDELYAEYDQEVDACAAAWSDQFNKRIKFNCPCDCKFKMYSTVQFVLHLNDRHKLTFTDIAHILEREGLNVPIHY